jgi:diguanylate cyclase (GGDEF)-like protein
VYKKTQNCATKPFPYFIVFITFIASLLLSNTVLANDFCNITPLDESHSHIIPLVQNKETKIAIKKGLNTLVLSCDLKNGGVISAIRPGIDYFSFIQNGIEHQPLKSGQIAYLLDNQSFTATITFASKFKYISRFKWQNTHDFFKDSQQHNLIMGIFYGLCITLILYVLIMGFRLNDNTFRLYSTYIFFVGCFVLLQEGQIYLFLDKQYSALLSDLYLLSIGFAIISVTFFMCTLLELNRGWPKFSKTLKVAAYILLSMCIFRYLSDNELLWAITTFIIRYGALAIVAALFCISAIQARNKVSDAPLIFIAFSLVLLSTIFRVLLVNQNPFLQRYGFIISLALESFLLAVAVSKRIGRIRFAKQQAETEADYDALCNILNRRGWNKKAARILEQQRATGGVLCLLYIDLDNFKKTNDEYGHSTGDNALCKVADFFKNHVRANDALGRIGGDEFVYFAHFNNLKQVDIKFDTILLGSKKLSLDINGNQLPINISIGRTDFITSPESIDEILKAGDKAMYTNKAFNKHLPKTD